VVALKQPDTHHPGLHRFFQGVTWFWAGLFLLLTLGMSFMMITEPYKLFMVLSSAVTIGLTLVGAAICVVWFLAVVRRLGLRLRFSAVLSPRAGLSAGATGLPCLRAISGMVGRRYYSPQNPGYAKLGAPGYHNPADFFGIWLFGAFAAIFLFAAAVNAVMRVRG
jgi:hypothetical protein